MSLHEKSRGFLGQKPPVPHDADHVGVPGLLDVVGGDDDGDPGVC